MKKIVSTILIVAVLATMLASCKKHIHSNDDWKTVKEATCTEDGLREAICECGEKITKTISATGHNYVDGICEKCKDISVEPTANEYFTFTELDDGTYSIAAKDITNLPDILILPSTYNGKPITVITENAFAGKIINEEIEYNGQVVMVQTFVPCDIKTVAIPESVTKIDNRAFENCYNLTRVLMGNSVTHIGDHAFASCAFRSIDLSKSLTYIGEYAFMNRIEYLVLPDSLITIAPHAFNSSSLVSITIPQSVKEIGSSAFGLCSFLREIVNNSSVEIDYVSSTLLEIHSGESKIENINEGYLFYKHDGKNLLIRYIGNETDLVLPENINGESYEIYIAAFSGLHNIKSIVIPEGVEVIHQNAFFWCDSLERAYLPKSLTTIHGVPLFGSCNMFTDVYYSGSQEDGKAITIIPQKIYAMRTYTFEDIIAPAQIHYNYKPER